MKNNKDGFTLKEIFEPIVMIIVILFLCSADSILDAALNYFMK